MIPPDCKTYGTRREPSSRRKDRRELIAAILVGLTLAAFIAYEFYRYSINHPTSG